MKEKEQKREGSEKILSPMDRATRSDHCNFDICDRSNGQS